MLLDFGDSAWNNTYSLLLICDHTVKKSHVNVLVGLGMRALCIEDTKNQVFTADGYVTL